MSRADRERWQRKYAGGNPNAAFTPDPLLVRHAELFDGRGWALDAACGVGQNAMFLARLGYDVLAVDASVTGLRYGRAALTPAQRRVHFVAADLERFPLPRDRFAVVTVFRFLDRVLVPHLKHAVAPGGLIVYETFNVNRLRTSPQMTCGYLLEPTELAQMFADFDVIETNDDARNRDELSYWIGRKPR